MTLQNMLDAKFMFGLCDLLMAKSVLLVTRTRYHSSFLTNGEVEKSFHNTINVFPLVADVIKGILFWYST